MDRPGWNQLEEAIRLGKVSAVVVWRIDRLGRTASGLTALFDDLQQRKVNLVSLKDGLDLATPAGRLMANVLASVAQYETEIRGERVAAGQAVARTNGKRWGGSKPGIRKKVTPTQERMIRQSHDLYGEERIRQYLILTHGEPAWQKVLNDWQIRTVLLPAGSTLTNLLREVPKDWLVVYEDKVAVVFERR